MQTYQEQVHLPLNRTVECTIRQDMNLYYICYWKLTAWTLAVLTLRAPLCEVLWKWDESTYLHNGGRGIWDKRELFALWWDVTIKSRRTVNSLCNLVCVLVCLKILTGIFLLHMLPIALFPIQKEPQSICNNNLALCALMALGCLCSLIHSYVLYVFFLQLFIFTFCSVSVADSMNLLIWHYIL